jgi:DMSO reductase family type II enzyme heme b subunit
MLAPYVSGMGTEEVLDPEGRPWRAARPERVRVIGTPLGLQPTDAIRVAWAGKRIGAVERVAIAAAHDGRTLAFRLEWSDPTENRTTRDTTEFPDAVAVLLPVVPGASIATMGAPGAPVTAWYWRADEEGRGRQVVAEGIGTTRTVDRELVRARGEWKDGRWRVVIARALEVRTAEPLAQLRAGELTQFGVAVWEGAHGERAGIKAFSGDWRSLRLASAPSARR